MGDYFRFDLVFIKKKITKPNFFIKKTETGSNRQVSVRFFRIKTDSNRFDLVFLLGLVFSFFSGFFDLDPVRFFYFRLIKLKPNRTDQFFQKFNQYFFTV
jgi:hypothetical protein